MSEVIRVNCPHCSKSLKAPPKARGRSVECSGCGGMFRVPDVDPQPASTPSRSSSKSGSGRSSRSGSSSSGRPRKSSGSSRSGKPRKTAPAAARKDEAIEEMESVEDMEVVEEMESLDGGYDDVEVVEEYDDYDDYGDDDYGEDDPFGYDPEDEYGSPALPGKSRKSRSSAPPRKKKKKKAAQRDAWSMERGILSGSTLGGLAAMVGAAVWFFVGLQADRIFFYPPVLFVIGLIGFVRGLLE